MEVEVEIKLRATETPTDRRHRHRMEVRRFWIEEAPIPLTAIGIAVSGTVLALVLTFRPGSTFQEKQWAFSVPPTS